MARNGGRGRFTLGTQSVNLGLKLLDAIADLAAHRLQLRLLRVELACQFPRFSLKLVHRFHDFEQLIFGLGLVDLLGVDLNQESLILPIVLGVLLLGAKAFDLGVAGFQVQVELSGLGLLILQRRVAQAQLLRKVVDFPLLNANVFADGIQPGLGFAEILVGLI